MKIENNKFRVEKFSEVDLDTASLIRQVENQSFWFFILIFMALANGLYFMAFTIILFIFSFKIQKEYDYYQKSDEIIKDLKLINNNNLNNNYSTHLGTIVKKHFENGESINFINGLKKSFGLKYKSEIVDSQVLTGKKGNAVAPVLMTDEMLREHTCLMATTGGGKTELLISGYIDSTLARGGGAFIVMGKNDNKMLQKIQTVASQYNRLQDIVVYDWAADKEGKTNSNTINIFETGNSKNITTTLVNIAKFDDDTWGKGSKAYLTAFLNFVLSLSEADFFIATDKIDDVFEAKDTFEEYQKHTKQLDYFAFQKLITDNDLLIKLMIIFDRIYYKNKKELNDILYKKFQKIIDKEESKNINAAFMSSEERNQVHIDLKQVIVNQSRVPNWQELSDVFCNGVNIEKKTQKGLDALTAKYPSNNGVFYNLGVSISNLKTLFEFFDSFPSILKSQSNDISILDAIDANRIVVFNIPGQNKVYAPIISELVISLLNSLLERRGKDFKSDTTTLVILDEINSWLKTQNSKSYGVGDIQSVVRSLNMATVLSFQSDIKETLGSVDASQVLANSNTIITLKLEDEGLVKVLNERIKKVRKLELEENQHIEYRKRGSSKVQTQEVKFNKSEEDFFQDKVLAKIQKGEGYIIRNGEVAPIMSRYLELDNLYGDKELDAKKEIMLNRFISLGELKKELL